MSKTTAMASSTTNGLQGRHCLCLFPLHDGNLDRIKDSGMFDTVDCYPSIYRKGTSHPDAYWNHEPADVPAEIEQRATHLLTIGFTMHNRTAGPNVKLIQTFTAGIDHIRNREFFKTLPEEDKAGGLHLCNASGVHSTTIGEYALMQTLKYYHRSWLLDEMQRSAHWDRDPYCPPGTIDGTRELRGRTMGVLGYGCIGRECARLAHAFGMRIVAGSSKGVKTRNDNFTLDGTGDPEGNLPQAWYKTGDEAQLREFLSQSDVIVICCPLTDETKHIINSTTLAHVKPSAFLINISRGGTVDQDALIASLDDGRLGGAALDVTDPEPLPDNHPLWTHPKITLTPHVAGSGEHYESRCVDLLLLNTQRLRDGKLPLNRVDLTRGY